MSELRVDSIKNQAGTGSPTFTGNITAGGFVVSGSSGFLKADGSVDTNTYLSSINVGDGTVTFSTTGTGLSLSASPSFDLNQNSNKNITISLSSTSGATASTLVSRDSNGDSAFRRITATGASGQVESTTIISNTSLQSKDRFLFNSSSAVNNPTTITQHYQTPGMGPDASGIMGIGMSIVIGVNNPNPAALELYKTRGSVLSGGARSSVVADDALGAIVFSGDDGSSDHVGAVIYGSVTRENWSNSSNKGTHFKFVYKADDSFGTTTPNREWVTIGQSTSAGDTVGPTTIRVPFAASTTQSSNCSFDSLGRLVRQASSAATKTNIETLDRTYAYNMLNNLRPVWYRSLASADNPEWSWYGMIAEEAAEVDPRVVTWGYADDQYNFIQDNETGVNKRVLKDNAELSPQGIQYDRLAVILWKIVQDQQTSITDLEAKVRQLSS